ncbi:MAG: outer membrane lipoprotein chaperone LolA [Gammaproteobacteria bacterium]|nr:outer membrane lipoprotein chaperone LolA [Gammaproteobacteria bacterium]
MLKQLVKYAVLAATLVHTALVGADPGSVQLERFLGGLKSLQAVFEQSLFGPERSTPLFSRGIFYLQRPDRFRWDYQAPDQQQIVADGRQIWLYDPGLEQVSVQSQGSALKGTPAALLIGREAVSATFEVENQGSGGGLEWVALRPRDEDSQFSRINLGLANDELLRMEMIDKFGSVTRFRFSEIRHNPDLEASLFEFQVPDGVDRYNQ